MSIEVRFIALYVAWLVASLTEARELGDVHAGVNVDEPKTPHQWHGELPLPQPVLLPREPQPVPRMVNTSMMVNDAWQEQQNRDALFTLEVARKNARDAALHISNPPPLA